MLTESRWIDESGDGVGNNEYCIRFLLFLLLCVKLTFDGGRTSIMQGCGGTGRSVYSALNDLGKGFRIIGDMRFFSGSFVSVGLCSYCTDAGESM